MTQQEKEREVQPVLPETIREALEMILTYLWDDERADFLANPKEGHVFPELVAVSRWLDGHWRTRRDWDSSLEYFGVCPECRRHNGYLNIGRVHWYVCHTHRLKWCVGENLFRGWRSQNEVLWQKNRKRACGRGVSLEWIISHQELARIRNEGLLPVARN